MKLNPTNTTIETLDEKDYKYILEKPEEGFNPVKNQMAIKKAIDSGMEIERLLRRAAQKDMENRVDVLASYARSTLTQGHTQSLEKFVGKQEMAKIYGEKLLEKIRILESVERLNKQKGNTMLGGKFFLT